MTDTRLHATEGHEGDGDHDRETDADRLHLDSRRLAVRDRGPRRPGKRLPNHEPLTRATGPGPVHHRGAQRTTRRRDGQGLHRMHADTQTNSGLTQLPGPAHSAGPSTGNRRLD